MIETINELDHSLMLLLNYDGGAFQDAFWYLLSNKFAWIPLYVSILGIFLYDAIKNHNWKRFATFLFITIFVIILSDRFTSGFIKPWAQRPRPSHQAGIMEQLHYVNGYTGGAYGFVSSHASNTFAICILLSMIFRNRLLQISMVMFALFNCYSRIYLGVHYPGDILCGAFIGILCGWWGYFIYGNICTRLHVPHFLQSKPLPISLTFWISIVAFLTYAIF